MALDAVTEELIAGLIATVLLGAGTWTIRRGRNRRVERRYPVAGRYATIYEDRVDGSITRVKALCTLSQRGRRLVGETTNLHDGRCWKVEGRLASGGRVYGTYVAEDPTDTGLGGFFLEILDRGHLEGVWSGYDAKNKDVTAGRYEFRQLANVGVRPLSPSDVTQALAILGEALGERYLDRSELASYIDGASPNQSALVAEIDGQIVGAATLRVQPFREFIESLPEEHRQTLRAAAQWLGFNRIGVIAALAVSPNARGAGVASELVRRGVDWLRSAGATRLTAIGWTDASGCHIEGVMLGHGFEEIARIERFWHEDSLRRDYGCPTCGQPCECEARIFSIAEADLP